MPALAPVITTVCVIESFTSWRWEYPSHRSSQEDARRAAHSRSSACTKACGRFPRSWRSAHVVLLGEQAGRAARGPVALEPADRLDLLALLVQGEGQDETAQHERAFGLAERPLVVPEPVGVAVLDQFGQVGVQRLDGARIVGGQRAADRREQQRGVDARVTG